MSSPGLKPSIELPTGRRYAPLPLRAKRRNAGESLTSGESSVPLIVEDNSNITPATPVAFAPLPSSPLQSDSRSDTSHGRSIFGSPGVGEDRDSVGSYDSRNQNPTQNSFLTSLTPSSDPYFRSTISRERSVSDVSGVSGVSENDDPVRAYDVRDEEAPIEPFFSPIFQAALEEGLSISYQVVKAIEGQPESTDPTNSLNRLLRDARSLTVFESTDTRTIAVLGDSGEGKSSLINALLDFPEIAKTGDIGSACTSIVTEYRHNARNHTSPITVEVEYLSSLEIDDMIRELLWNYRQLYLPTAESDQVDSNEYARWQRESELAFSALDAAFKHQRGFNKALLTRDMSEAGLATITTQFIQWAHELEWPVSPDSSGAATWKSTAETADECYESTKIFMQDRFWPFTKIIRVYLNAHVLKTGLVLADLPGLQDTNLARVRATQDYLLKCDNILIVTNIARAITDQSLKSSLYKVLSQHVSVEWAETGGKSLNIAIVCTKSETINETTAKREFCGDNKKIPAHVIEQLDRDIDNAKKSGKKELKKELKRNCGRTFLFIDARNRHVREGLQNAYSSSVPGGQLDVFCVSNTTYEKFSRKGNTDMVKASGVPELRRFCQTITANAQLHEALHFLRSSLSSLLNSVALSLSVHAPIEGHVPDEEIIKAVLQEQKREVSQVIKGSETDFKVTFVDCFSEYLEQRNRFWEDAAKSKSQEWSEWHNSQYNAWCKNNGDHTTPKRGSVNWNSQLIWKMRMELDFQWSLVEEEIPDVFRSLNESIKLHLIELREHLSIEDDELLVSIAEAIDLRVQDIEYKIGLRQQKFTREVKAIHRYAAEPNQSSYIVAEMLPAYRSAASQAGAGMKARQNSIVQERITNGTLIPQVSAKILDSMSNLIQHTFKCVQELVDSVLDLVESDINMVLEPRRGDGVRALQSSADKLRIEEFTDDINGLRGIHVEILDEIADL